MAKGQDRDMEMGKGMDRGMGMDKGKEYKDNKEKDREWDMGMEDMHHMIVMIPKVLL
jgi:hypothetical protein